MILYQECILLLFTYLFIVSVNGDCVASCCVECKDDGTWTKCNGGCYLASGMCHVCSLFTGCSSCSQTDNSCVKYKSEYYLKGGTCHTSNMECCSQCSQKNRTWTKCN